jgi:5-methylcytosine-specific restriction endonuclease McrA
MIDRGNCNGAIRSSTFCDDSAGLAKACLLHSRPSVRRPFSMLRSLLRFRQSPRLTIELVPSPCWGKTVRALLSPHEWRTIQETVFESAAGKCQVCGWQGGLRCHTVWRYDERQGSQALEGFLALCRFCHEVKHIGLTELHGRYPQAIAHLASVNRWSKRAAAQYADGCFETHDRRSRREWTQNLTALKSWLGRDRGAPLQGQRRASLDTRHGVNAAARPAAGRSTAPSPPDPVSRQ